MQRSVAAQLKPGDRIPSTAQRLHQQDGGIHPPSSNFDLVALVVEIGSLSGDDLEVVATATAAGSMRVFGLGKVEVVANGIASEPLLVVK